MLKFLMTASALVFAGSAVAADAPVFPERKVAALTTAQADAPTGAQYRVRSGKSGVRYLACNEQRTYAGGNVELHCLSYSATKGWGKSLRWYPKYQLAGLKGELVADPVVTAIR